MAAAPPPEPLPTADMEPEKRKNLTIGIDASFLTRDQRGMGRFLRSILEQWEGRTPHRLILLCEHRRHLSTLEEYQRRGWEVCWEQECQVMDVCWFPWNRVDWEPICPRVVFIHDVAPFTMFHPEKHRQDDQQRLLEATDRADVVMTNSNFSRVEIRRYLGWPLEDVEVINLAYDHSVFCPLPDGQPQPELPKGLKWKDYLLFIGNLEPRKNLQGLLEALVLARKNVPMRLALVSPRPMQHWTERLRGRHDALVALAAELGDQLVWLDTSNDEELANLYRGARLFTMPSFYEGFGLPLLESIACGTPAVAAKAASLPEVGGAIPTWFNPKEPVDIARAIMEALGSPGPDPAAMQEHARNFSWGRTAAQILDCLTSVAARPPKRHYDSMELLAVGDELREEPPTLA